MNQEPYSFVLCVNDTYSQYIVVTVKSICDTHRSDKIALYIFTDYISSANQKILEDLVYPYKNAEIEFIIVNDSELRDLKDTWSIYTWYRVLIPALLPNVKRCLYLDADTIVVANLKDLFKMSMRDMAIGCVIDSENYKDDTRLRCRFGNEDIYVCAGIMLMNLEYWRKNNLSEQIIRWGKENDALIKFPDQDTINVLCNHAKIVLPIKYGLQPCFFNNDELLSSSYRCQIIEAYKEPCIIHYAGCAPWISEFSDNILHHYWAKFNKLLSRKVRLRYLTKGFNGLKVRMWRLFHPYNYEHDRLRLEKKLQPR